MPPQPPKPPLPWRGWIVAVVVAGLLWWSGRGVGFDLRVLLASRADLAEFFGRLFPTHAHPWPLDYLPEVRTRLLETVKIAFAASVFGSALALPYALLGARNLAAFRWVYVAGRVLLNLLRTIPDLVLAALFASTFGIGPLPGFLALTVFSFGVVAKLLCDTVETVDPGPLEALTATGATRLQRAYFAVLPQVGGDYVAYSLYAFEINVRAAAVLGLVGAGGIGTILQRDISFMNYSRVGLIIAATFLVVFVIDSFSTFLRGRLN